MKEVGKNQHIESFCVMELQKSKPCLIRLRDFSAVRWSQRSSRPSTPPTQDTLACERSIFDCKSAESVSSHTSLFLSLDQASKPGNVLVRMIKPHRPRLRLCRCRRERSQRSGVFTHAETRTQIGGDLFLHLLICLNERSRFEEDIWSRFESHVGFVDSRPDQQVCIVERMIG